jgi:hypothetical protein
MRARLVYLLIFGILLVGGFGVMSYLKSQNGKIDIVMQLPDTNNLSATVNGEPFNIVGLNATYRFHKGDKHLVISKEGYRPFSTDFTVVPGQTLIITVSMKLKNPATASESISQLQQSLVKSLPDNFTVQDTNFFYDSTWVVATVSVDENPAIIVASRDAGGTGWQIVLGPGTSFGDNDVAKLPHDVSSFMYEKRYVLPGIE